jgi:hypothetical protein
VRLVGLALVAGAVLVCPTGSEGQRSPAASAERDEALLPAAFSLVLPGAGQHMLGQRRKWAYLALEVAGWAFFVERRGAASGFRDRYRDFAWENARAQGATRVDGDFAYYETLSYWARSGAFDTDVLTAGVQPELDTGTYNGSVWSLAARLFLPGGTSAPPSDPAYPDALAYYGQEAYGDEMLWDWSGTAGAQSEFSGLVEASDSRFRHATTVLGVVLANHILSAGDAFVSSRGEPFARIRVEPSDAPGSQWDVVLMVRAPQ